MIYNLKKKTVYFINVGIISKSKWNYTECGKCLLYSLYKYYHTIQYIMYFQKFSTKNNSRDAFG